MYYKKLYNTAICSGAMKLASYLNTYSISLLCICVYGYILYCIFRFFKSKQNSYGASSRKTAWIPTDIPMCIYTGITILQ